jgi:hypothetical protein
MLLLSHHTYWLSCTINDSILLDAAKNCFLPPSPPEGGSVKVHNSGLMFGRDCSTGGNYIDIEGSGTCTTSTINQARRKTKQKIEVSKIFETNERRK